MSSVLLYSIDPNENRRRFYRMSVQQDLFGLSTLTVHWGRVGQRGSFRIHKSGDLAEMLREMQHRTARKIRNRYMAIP